MLPFMSTSSSSSTCFEEPGDRIDEVLEGTSCPNAGVAELRVFLVTRREDESLLEDSATEFEDAAAEGFGLPNFFAMVVLTSSRAILSFSGEGAGGGVRLTPLCLPLALALPFCGVAFGADLPEEDACVALTSSPIRSDRASKEDGSDNDDEGSWDDRRKTPCEAQAGSVLTCFFLRRFALRFSEAWLSSLAISTSLLYMIVCSSSSSSSSIVSIIVMAVPSSSELSTCSGAVVADCEFEATVGDAEDVECAAMSLADVVSLTLEVLATFARGRAFDLTFDLLGKGLRVKKSTSSSMARVRRCCRTRGWLWVLLRKACSSYERRAATSIERYCAM